MKLSKILAVCAILFALTACKTTTTGGTTNPPPTPAQVAARVCPTATLILQDVQTLATSAVAQKDLATIQPMLASVCSASSSVSFASLSTFNDTFPPLLVTLIKESNLDAATQQKDISAVDVVQLALTMAIQVQQTAVTTTTK